VQRLDALRSALLALEARKTNLQQETEKKNTKRHHA
jgi:hypothetical protein